jgi:hypothetical protein
MNSSVNMRLSVLSVLVNSTGIKGLGRPCGSAVGMCRQGRGEEQRALGQGSHRAATNRLTKTCFSSQEHPSLDIPPPRTQLSYLPPSPPYPTHPLTPHSLSICLDSFTPPPNPQEKAGTSEGVGEAWHVLGM